MYIITDGKRYVKHTSKFGPFYGRIVLTLYRREAHLFTREGDAKERVVTLMYRTTRYPEDKRHAGDWRVEET